MRHLCGGVSGFHCRCDPLVHGDAVLADVTVQDVQSTGVARFPAAALRAW